MQVTVHKQLSIENKQPNKEINYYSLSERLMSKGLIQEDQLAVAKIHKRHKLNLLGEILVELGFIDSWALQGVLSEHTGYPAIDLRHQFIDAKLSQYLSEQETRQYRLLLFAQIQNALHIAMADPEDIFAKDTLRGLFPSTPLVYYHADPLQIQRWCDQLYASEQKRFSTEEDIILLAQQILYQAVESTASDLHLQPEGSIIKVRLRLDGLLYLQQTLHRDLWAGLASRLKIMSGLDIAETRRPQSGRFSHGIQGREIHFRVSTHPTHYGESLAIRILDPAKGLKTLEDLGFTEEQITWLTQNIVSPEGMLVFCGPTGSGKTTSLYALLQAIDRERRHVVTLEEPIEYVIPGVRQTEIQHEDVLSYAEGIRSLMRQDPDVIMIGEVRDEKTAHMALRAALTGHLVLTTVHAATAHEAMQRLQDLGIAASQLSLVVRGIIAQRLVRTFCAACWGDGCPKCANNGYKGRCVVAEILAHSESQQWVLQSTFQQHAQSLVEAGMTTLQEIMRVIGKL